MRHFPITALTTILLSMSGLACQGEADPGPTVSVRDSSGISIVENQGSVDPDANRWVMDGEAHLSIGTLEGDSLQQLYEVQGVLSLPNGDVVLANAGSGEIRIYSSTGDFLRSIGRKGEGPGEFQSPVLAGFLPPDTLVVVDGQLRRLTLLRLDGEILEMATMDEEVGGGVFPRGVFSDGRVVVGGGFYFSSDSGDELSSGYSRRLTTYRAVSRDGSLSTDFGEFPGMEFFMAIRNQGGGVMMLARLIPFGKYPMAAVGEDRLYFASGDTWEIQAFSPEGELRELIRWDQELRPVGSGDVSTLIEARVEEAQDANQAQEIRQQYAEMPVPDFMPAFAGITVDALGYLWVERYRVPGEGLPEFDILDPKGGLVGWASLPEDADVQEIGDDFILALFEDELGIEYVRRYRLHRPHGE